MSQNFFLKESLQIHLENELWTITQTNIEQCVSHFRPTSRFHKLSSTRPNPIPYKYKAVLSHSTHRRVSILFNKINFNSGLAREKDVGTPVYTEFSSFYINPSCA